MSLQSSHGDADWPISATALIPLLALRQGELRNQSAVTNQFSHTNTCDTTSSSQLKGDKQCCG